MDFMINRIFHPAETKCLIAEATEIPRRDEYRNIQPGWIQDCEKTGHFPASPAKKVKSLGDLTPGKIGGIVNGRIESKGTIRTWKKDNEQGQLFSFVMSDGSADIQAVVSGDMCTEYHDRITVGQCYQITAFKVKETNPAYNPTNHPCELHLTKISKMVPIQGSHIPKSIVSRTTLAEIAKQDANKVVNVEAIVYEVGKPQSISCRDGITRMKQSVLLVDETLKIISLGLWAEAVQELDGMESNCVLVRNLQVKEYAGKKQLNSMSGTVVDKEPASETAKSMRLWWEAEGSEEEFEEIKLSE
ncbi:replication protein A 70 kDa DNA-binding subunit-like [Galendromus occidentalis]|uniref:Replication protein A 70 kDa DNA-binding subunit-like n=1 Tax=Galendromus occidentalis TaxID=34638 RepID=A0AAJ6VXV6_9ACAR|nr:replication protein A 70 kDa DNA-binding subunit-like [Galendromus occidentalis]